MPRKEMQNGEHGSQPRWQTLAELAPELNRESRLRLESLPDVLECVWPLSRKHRRDLPDDIRDLSAALTCDRGELKRGYWHKPAWISAYLYYFLPWNLVRLCRLLPALPLSLPEQHNGATPFLLDAGAGPFTLPIALWICRPDLRPAPLGVLALDSCKKPLELGKKLFEALGDCAGQQIWQLKYAVAPLEALSAMARNQGLADQSIYPWLVTAANVLNEINPGKQRDIDIAARLENLLAAWRQLWQEGTPLLFIEPGTRLGGAIIMHLRRAALECGLQPLSPCLHSKKCPLFEPDREGPPASWCHFVFSAQDAPQWLKELSQKAGLFKTSLSLSPLMLAKNCPEIAYPANALPCRVISQPFPTAQGLARYGCSALGLCLLPDSRNMRSGTLCLAQKPRLAERDRKSGARIVNAWANLEK